MTDYSTNEVLISVIIPYFNNGSTIEETLNSLNSQSFQNFEVIIVEDKNSLLLHIPAKNYKFNIITLKNTQNEGASSNRNLGLKHAKGKYIQYLDADDLISSDKLLAQYNLIKDEDEYIITCKWGDFHISETKAKFHPSELYQNWDKINFLNLLNGTFSNMMAIHCYLIPKKLVEKAGGWDETITVGDDGEFMNRVIFLAKKIIYCKEGIAYYRRSDPTSLSHKRSFLAHQSILLCCNSYKNLVIDIPELRKSIIFKYSSFYHFTYPNYKNLCELALKEIKSLGYNNILPLGSKKSIALQKIIGPIFFLKIKSLFNNAN